MIIRKFSSLFTEILNQTDTLGTSENDEKVIERMMGALTEIAETAKANGEKNVLVVSSGGAITTILPVLGGEGMGLKNASVTMLYYKDGEFTLGVIGDMSYAERGAEIRAEQTAE